MKARVALIVALIVVAIGATLLSVRERERADAWEDRAENALSVSDSLKVIAQQAEARAGIKDDSAADLAGLAAQQGRRVRAMADTVRAVVAPDTCTPFIAARDEVIDSAIAEADTWRAAYEVQRSAYGDLEDAVDAYRVRGDSLEAVLVARPERKWWMPRLGAGAYVGINPDGVARPGVGLTLSWSF